MTDYDNIYEDLISREDGPCIRLLTLLPKEPENPSEENDQVAGSVRSSLSGAGEKPATTDVEVELSTHRLEDCPEYEALSYCWGAPTGQKFHIKCNGHSFYALPSLRNALYALRLPDKPRTLWIDAICINQNTDGRALRERGQQVSMMQDIYRKAKRVVVWLGEVGEKDFSPILQNDHMLGEVATLHSLDGVVDELEQVIARHINVLQTDPAEFWNESMELRTNWEKMVPNIKESAARLKADWAQRPEGEPQPWDAAGEDDSKIVRKFSKYVTNSKWPMQLVMGMLSWRGAVENLISRVWWNRVWIIQESCLACDITFQCGNTLIGMDQLFLGFFLSCFYSRIYSMYSSNSLINGWVLLEMMKYRDLYLSQGETKTPGLLHLLAGFSVSDATDPKDKVYSLMGLLAAVERDSLKELRLIPDYTITTKHCYTTTAKALCTLSRNLDILALATVDPQTKANMSSAEMLPSWVPDWRLKSSTILSPIHGFGSSNGDTSLRNFSASGSTEWTPKFRDENTLVVSGFVTDMIVKVVDKPLPDGNPLRILDMALTMANENGDFKGSYDDTLLDIFRQFKTSRHKAMDVAVAVGNTISAIYEWEEFVKANKAAYPTGEDMVHVMCAVRCYGYLPNGLEAALKSYKKFVKGTNQGRMMYNLLSKKGESSGSKSEPSRLRQALMTVNTMPLVGINYSKRVASFNTLQKYSIGRKLAWTGKGYLALVAQDTAVGDKVVLCKGSKFPLVMKSTSQPNQWQVVEGCYVHGIMQGEAWDETQCVEMNLV